MRAIDIVRALCPNARPDYVAAFEAGDALIEAAGITTPRRLAHFMAQVCHETDGLSITVENMNYSAGRIPQVWPSRPEAVRFAHDPEGLANSVYADRMGNGPASSGDGWRYRGRGMMQTTGRAAYREWGRKIGVDLEADPDLILSAEHALKPALYEWEAGGCNAFADRDDITRITQVINGGKIGLDSRKAWLAKIRRVLPGAEKKLAKSRTMGGLGLISAGIATDQGSQSIGDGLSTIADQLAPVAAVSDRVASIIAVIKAMASIAVVAGLAWAAYARWDDAGRPLPAIAPGWLTRILRGDKPGA